MWDCVEVLQSTYQLIFYKMIITMLLLKISHIKYHNPITFVFKVKILFLLIWHLSELLIIYQLTNFDS